MQHAELGEACALGDVFEQTAIHMGGGGFKAAGLTTGHEDNKQTTKTNKQVHTGLRSVWIHIIRICYPCAYVSFIRVFSMNQHYE